MKREDVEEGAYYDCMISGQVVGCRVIRKHRFRALVTYGSQWSVGDPITRVYKNIFYRKFVEKK